MYACTEQNRYHSHLNINLPRVSNISHLKVGNFFNRCKIIFTYIIKHGDYTNNMKISTISDRVNKNALFYKYRYFKRHGCNLKLKKKIKKKKRNSTGNILSYTHFPISYEPYTVPFILLLTNAILYYVP